MNKHFMTDSHGDLFDTRKPQWHKGPAVRKAYSYHFREIDTVAKLKATLRAGEYAWPGLYRLYFITTDGAVLSFAAVKQEFASVIWSISNEVSDGWRVCALACTDMDSESVYCDHTGDCIYDAEEEAAQ